MYVYLYTNIRRGPRSSHIRDFVPSGLRPCFEATFPKMLEEPRLRSDFSRKCSKTLDFEAILIDNAFEETVEDAFEALRNHWVRSVLARACNARVRAGIWECIFIPLQIPHPMKRGSETEV